MTRYLLITITLFSLCTCYAQDFSYSADLKVPEDSGLFSIVLSPELVGRSQKGLGDIRLKDTSDKNVPFVIEIDKAVSEQRGFVPFKMIRNDIVPDRFTVIEIEPEHRSKVDQIHLRIANATVSKSVRITGSDTRLEWFAIKDDHVHLTPNNEGETSSLSILELPLTDHAFYRITIADSTSPPLKVLDVGHLGRMRTRGTYTEASGFSITRSKQANETIIAIHCPHKVRVDKITFDIADDRRFIRPFEIRRIVHLNPTRRQRRSGQRASEHQALFRGELSSQKTLAFETPTLYLDTAFIVISNGDDEELLISDITLEQLEHRLTAELDANKQYRLLTGNADVRPPEFDIVHFVGESMSELPIIQMGPLEPLAQPGLGRSFQLSRSWIWGILSILILFILFMVYKLVRDKPK